MLRACFILSVMQAQRTVLEEIIYIYIVRDINTDYYSCLLFTEFRFCLLAVLASSCFPLFDNPVVLIFMFSFLFCVLYRCILIKEFNIFPFYFFPLFLF